MGYGYYGFYGDPLFLAVIVMFFVSLAAQAKVKSTYARFSRVSNMRGLTAERAVRMVLDYYGADGVAIERIGGNLTDHYDPKTRIISLSESVYGSSSIAAIGVACHEAGHAVQDAVNFVPIKVRNAIVPVCNIGSMIGLPLAILGVFLNSLNLIYVGLALYSFVFIFQLITLPVELDASRRALKVINERDILDGEERRGAKSVLTAAAMTYVAALVTSFVNLFRFVYIFLGGRGSRR